MKCVVKQDMEGKELRLVFGEVYAPNRPDADGEFMTEESIMKMAHRFVRNNRASQVDTQHDNKAVSGVSVVESFIARKGDPDFIEGSWVVGVHVPDDETWEAIKSNKINGFSMEALVIKTTVEAEVEIPPVITGMTSKSEDHTHKFYVTYDENGKFLGGITDDTLGHQHQIKTGTLTEMSAGHSHTFSSVDNVFITGD